MKRLFPTEYVSSVYDINYENLFEKGIRGLIFDIDNTLVPYFVKESDDQLIELFTKLREMDFKISLVSNGKKDRVMKFNEKLKVYAFPRANKPGTVNLKKAMKVMNTDSGSTVMIGDQIFTDVWAANRAGMTNILVEPISEKDEFITWIKRGIEGRIIKKYKKKVRGDSQ